MKLSQLIRGLEILRPHYKNGDGYHIGAEHDQFYAYATDTPLDDHEVAEMKALGWFQPDAPDGEDECNASTSPYAAEEGWSAWT